MSEMFTQVLDDSDSSIQTFGDEHKFEGPAKLIKTMNDMKLWEKSDAYMEYLGFILAINEAVKGKSNTDGSKDVSQNVLKVITLLEKIDEMIDDIPPIQQPQRFGNKAFAKWYRKLRDDILPLLQTIFPTTLYRSIPEVMVYLVDGFGNPTRIDYGTGHEISFIMFLCCLFKIKFLKPADKLATGSLIFPRYLDLARKLQTTYRMEPAGSHGVWSLDDYQFVPFIWGSSQLIAHPRIEPSSFLQQDILNNFGEDYMFLKCIQYINSVKTGPFAEHSNQLWGISGVPSWTKVNGGLIKMYKNEVLGKFPVAQHIVFGSLFTLKPAESTTGLVNLKTSFIQPPNRPVPVMTAKKSTSTTTPDSSVGSGGSDQKDQDSDKSQSLKSSGGGSDVS